MACAIRRWRPGRAAVIVYFEQDDILRVAQADGSLFVGEAVEVRSGHVGDAIDCPDIDRVMRHDGEGASGQDGSWREGGIDIPGKPEAADILMGRVGVV